MAKTGIAGGEPLPFPQKKKVNTPMFRVTQIGNNILQKGGYKFKPNTPLMDNRECLGIISKLDKSWQEQIDRFYGMQGCKLCVDESNRCYAVIFHNNDPKDVPIIWREVEPVKRAYGE